MMLRFVPLIVALSLYAPATVVEAQTENLGIDARLFASADAVILGKQTATRSGALQPVDIVSMTKVLKNNTNQTLAKQAQVGRGEFSPPIPRSSAFIYLRWNKPNQNWQLLRSIPFLRLSIFGDRKKFGFKDQNGKVVIAATYDDCYPFGEGLAPVAIDGKWGLIDSRGQVLVKPRYGRIQPFSHGRAAFEDGAMHGFLGVDGSVAIKAIFDNALGFREGLAPVSLKGRWGFIRPDGSTAIKPQFQRAGYFSEGLASVTDRGKVGYINQQGATVIKPRFDGGGLFRNGKARVMVGELAGVIDTKGNWVSKPRVLED